MDPMGALFVRWRDRQDTLALAKVFDQVAPDLLRLALHLASGPADAEDLLQQTFLAAMESADRFDPRRELIPWLTAILRNRAKNSRRRQRREVQTADGTPTVLARGDDPERQTFSAETEERVVAAIDQLQEPYRQAVLLHLRHGLQPADVAHVLGRSPGTVRVQLHRGMKQLRALLPAGLAGSLTLMLSAPRGLAMVRTAVLHHAHALAAPAGATGVLSLGGFVMAKKILVAAVAVVLVCLGVWQWGIDPAPSKPAPAADALTSPHAAAALATKPASDREPKRREQPEAPKPKAGAATLRGRVLDAATRQPVPGADVAFYLPREVGMDELRRRFHGILRTNPNGSLQTAKSAFVQIPDDLPFAVLTGDRPHPFVLPPDGSTRAVARTTTDSEGRFALADVPEVGGIRVTAQGYGPRFVPAPQPDSEANFDIEIYRPRVVDGLVVDQQHNPQPNVEVVLAHQCGYWSTTTGDDGRFQVTVAAPAVAISLPTRRLRSIAWRPAHREAWHGLGIDPMLLGPVPHVDLDGPRFDGTSGRDRSIEIQVAVASGAWLHVTDATTRKPIELFYFKSQDKTDHPAHCGRFYAPEGYLFVRPSGAYGWGMSIRKVVVWTAAHAPAVVELPATNPKAPIEVALQPGQPPVIGGFVRERATPVADVTVQLRFVHFLNQHYNLDKIVDLAQTNANGEFELTAPAGRYLLEVLRGKERELVHRRMFDVPTTGPTVIDLADTCAIDVVIRDEKGQPMADYPAAVRKPDQGNLSGRTDATGTVRLGPLTAGQHVVFTSAQRTKGSYAAGHQKTITLEKGEVARVEFRILTPADIKLQLRINDPTVADFRGFQARLYQPPYGIAKVQPTGVLNLRFASKDMTLLLEAPDGRNWKLRLPRVGPSEREMRLPWPGRGYAGTVRDELGRPLPGVRIRAAGRNGAVEDVSSISDKNGRFELRGLGDQRYALLFQATTGRTEDPLRIGKFQPASKPSHPPTQLDLRVPALSKKGYRGRESVTIHGRVLDASGRPAGNATVMIQAKFDGGAGEWTVSCDKAWMTTDDKGAFAFEAAAAPRYHVQWQASGKVRHQKVVQRTGGQAMTLDLRLTR